VLESGGCQALRVLDLSSSTWIKNTTLQRTFFFASAELTDLGWQLAGD
jgi:hypothetical protein